MPDQNITQWRPPEEKIVHRWVVGIGIAAAVVVGALLIKAFVPTVADALALVQKLLANTISTIVTGVALVVVLWLVWQTFSPKGKINGLFAQAYSSAIHSATVAMMNVDPMSPLKDSRAEIVAKKAEYDEQFARFDGTISNFQQREDQLRAQAAQAEKRARAAQAQGDTDNFNRYAYEQGSEVKAADSIAAMREHLVPVRAIIVRLQKYSADLIWQLDIDIKTTQDQWDAANQLAAMDKSARKIMSGGDKASLAAQAQNIVQTKYATSIGRLNNLGDLAKNVLDSADLDKATYSQDLLLKWQAEDAQSSGILTAQVVHPAIAAPAPSSFAGLIGR